MLNVQLHKDKIKSLLKKGVTDDAFALHGTSVKSALVLFETGLLPGAKSENTEGRLDQLFFAPVDGKMVLEASTIKNKSELVVLNDTLTHSGFDSAMKSAEGYAVLNSVIFEVEERLQKLGVDSKYSLLVAENIIADEKLEKVPKDVYLQISDERWREMSESYYNAKNPQGIILAVNRTVAELGIKVYPHDEGISVCAPNGLDAKYIDGLIPLSEKDKLIIKEYLRKSS